MGVYMLAAILVVGIPFLLYCLWNFSREIKPRKAPVFFSAVPTWSSVPAMPVSRPRRQNASLKLNKADKKVVHRPDSSYPRPARLLNCALICALRNAYQNRCWRRRRLRMVASKVNRLWPPFCCPTHCGISSNRF
jgi:hypothetical protein